MAVVGIGDTLDVIGEMPWCQTVQASINEHSQLEVDVFRRPQPVQVPQHRCDVLWPRRAMYQSDGGIEHRLKSTKLGRWKPCECCIAVIETWNNQHNLYLFITVVLKMWVFISHSYRGFATRPADQRFVCQPAQSTSTFYLFSSRCPSILLALIGRYPAVVEVDGSRYVVSLCAELCDWCQH